MNLTDEEIENEGDKLPMAAMRGAFKAGAKFARDHSPKFKTLEEHGWKQWGDTMIHVRTPVGEYQISYAGDHPIINISYVWFDCESIDEAKERAQSDYENKLKALLK